MMLEQALPGDREAVNALALQVHRLHVRWRPDIYTDTASLYPPERFSEEREAGHLYVVRQEGGVVAYVRLLTSEIRHPGLVKRKILSLDELCVDESCRGQHVGQALYDYAVNYARQIGCDSITLNVWCGNDRAMTFYEKQGLKPRNIHMEYVL